MSEPVADGWVEVPPEDSVPKGWKKKVYRMNGRLNPRWVQYYDTEENRYNNLQSVEVRKQQLLQMGALSNSEAPKRAPPGDSRIDDLNSQKTIKRSIFNCNICNIEYNNNEELQEHIRCFHREEKKIAPVVKEESKQNTERWEELDESLAKYDAGEETVEDEFLQNKTLKSMSEPLKPVMTSPNSWYASVEQIRRRFGVQDYHVPEKIANLMKFKDEERFVEYVTPLLRTVNPKIRLSRLHILAKAKWFELMQGQGVTPLNGSLTTLRKPRMILVNSL